jgi:hypothetical protein
MTEADAVRQVLADRGCPDEMVRAGLAGLAEKWATIVASVEEGYAFGLDDLLNDMDLRDLLAAALDVAPAVERTVQLPVIAALDARLQAASVRTGCLWGDDVEEDDGLAPEREWWYYLRPAQLNDDLAAELAAWGLLNDTEDDA